jgi:hypothetical protein
MFDIAPLIFASPFSQLSDFSEVFARQAIAPRQKRSDILQMSFAIIFKFRS